MKRFYTNLVVCYAGSGQVEALGWEQGTVGALRLALKNTTIVFERKRESLFNHTYGMCLAAACDMRQLPSWPHFRATCCLPDLWRSQLRRQLRTLAHRPREGSDWAEARGIGATRDSILSRLH